MGGWDYDQVALTMNALSWLQRSQTLIRHPLSAGAGRRAHMKSPPAFIKATVTHSFMAAGRYQP